MLIFSRQNLAYLAVPKTGTTSVEMALRSRADIVFSKHRKHMPARGFHNRVAPFLENAFGLRPMRVAVMRDPEDQLSSWYRYRTQANLRGSSNSTADMSFDAFVLDAARDDPPDHAAVGSQFSFLTSSGGDVLVHRLYAYEARDQFYAFLNERFGEELEFKHHNVSPKAPTSLSAAARAKLHAARSQEFELYARLMDAGGVLEFTVT